MNEPIYICPSCGGDGKETYKCLKDTPTGSYKAGVITDNPLCADFPEYFAKYKFTTHDGVDKYVGDEYFIVDLIDKSITQIFRINSYWNYAPKENLIRFSTPEAAQAYLDEQNKPKFEVGDFVKWSGYNTAFGRITEEASGDYFKLSLTFDETTSETHNSCHYSNLTKMTPEEIESALIKEAERRGFKDGVEIKRCDNLRHYAAGPDCNVIVVGTETNYSTVDYSLEYGDRYIYHKGKWASIISEPEEEMTTLDYIEDFHKSGCSLTIFLEEKNLIITKAPSNA